MVQNLKVDIIYHQSPSDFELEFNLCGCCRMRLLSDKTSDKKALVKALARDVARSRIIICCGPLFGDEGLINVITRAIGSNLCLCDNKTYGINSQDPIHIINGSTPLVTPDGYFGGCIIESGPQTIILLTENKSFRKAIMQNLIHPYVEEISYSHIKTPVAEPVQPEPEYEPAVTEEEVYLTQPDDYDTDISEVEDALPIAEDEQNIEFVMDDEPDNNPEESEPLPVFETEQNIEFVMDKEDSKDVENVISNIDDGYNIMYTEVETESEIKARYQDPYVPSESDNMFITEHDTEEPFEKPKATSRKLDIAIVLLVMLLLLGVLALVYLMVLRPISMGVPAGQYIKEIFGLASDTISV